MAKKRPTLDSFLNSQSEADKTKNQSAVESSPHEAVKQPSRSVHKAKGKDSPGKAVDSLPQMEKHEIVRHMLYLPLPVYDQLQGLIFEEQRGQAKRRKTHDYLLDAIDLLFKKKGLKSIAELTGKDD
jgi:hypothetical protein